MELPRRRFLHLAAGAMLRFSHRAGASLSVATGPYHCALSGWRVCRHQCATGRRKFFRYMRQSYNLDGLVDYGADIVLTPPWW
jgi:hypothetical protein